MFYRQKPNHRIEWPTLGIAVFAYGGFAVAIIAGSALGPWAVWALLTLVIALHASLQHEILHGHPFHATWANEALAFPPLGLWVPYERFRDTHLAHHYDPHLTDPYDDPESNFVDPCAWAAVPTWRRRIHEANNTLAGRVVLGPVLGMAAFYRSDLVQLRAGQTRVWRAYMAHLLGVALALFVWTGISSGPLWPWLLASYTGQSLIKIRTFLEHRAHVLARGRTVIIEDRGLLAFLFLNNNLHAVHHAHPNVPWYRLPQVYAQDRAAFQRRNDGYVYRSYAQIAAQFLWHSKDPVPHPLMAVDPSLGGSGRKPMHTLGPLQADERAFDAGQHKQT